MVQDGRVEDPAFTSSFDSTKITTSCSTTIKKEIDDQIDFVLSTVGMAKKGYKWPHQLSGGEQQRVVIARALLNSPELIIADEPTGNLDPQTGRELMELLHAISQSGTAVIMATHNMQFIEEYPAKCYFCAEGKLRDCSE